MKRILLIPLLLCASAFGQGARYDGSVTTSATNVPPGAQAPVYTVPYAVVTVCTYPANASPCTNTNTIYSDPALTHVLPNPLAADAHGKFGFWAAPGVYAYSVTSSGGTNYGTYNISLAGTGGGSATFPSTPGVVYSSNASTARNGTASDVVGLFSGCSGTQVLQANGACGTGGQTYLSAGANVTITGSGTSGSPYVISSGSSTPLTISSFSGCWSAELGAAIVNPSFTAAYGGTPTSANITNTDSINSPHALTTPFTSGSLSGSFGHSSAATVTFTLNASDGTNNPTASCNSSWNPRIFGGVGASGATSTVTASGTTAVLSTTDALPSVQLGAESVGQTLGTFSPSGQTIYLLLTGGSHSFVDTGTGFPMAFNSPATVSFVNANGVTLTMYLYQSTNTLTGTFTPKVSS